MKVTESILAFLQARKTDFNSDLVDRIATHWPQLECQVNVAADEGEPVAGKRSTYTDGVNEWFNIRMPNKADSDPSWKDYPISFPLDVHGEGIGLTGWDWVAKRSRWVGFDVDSITSHAEGVGISDEDMARVREAVQALPYVEVRRSTGGGGLHLYVYLDVPTTNHTEHAALARSILGLMSEQCGFDFASHVDCCGSVMWVWHRKMAGTRGLEVLKNSDRALIESELPANWKEHVAVVSRKKIKLGGVSNEQENAFDDLASSRRVVPLDEQHKATIDELMRLGYSTVWVAEYHLLQTHTKALQELYEAGGIKGVFKTLSEGRDKATCNCFGFPTDNGGWHFYRFSQGVAEADNWTQNGEGWTNCYFNQPVSFEIAAQLAGGEATAKDRYAFANSADLEKACDLVGGKIKVPESLAGREAHIKISGRRAVASIKKLPSEAAPAGWVPEKGYFIKSVAINEIKAQISEASYTRNDKIVRSLINCTGSRAGWAFQSSGGEWITGPKDDVKSILKPCCASTPEFEDRIGEVSKNPWKMVSIPFQPEYPGGRRWNRDAAQYCCDPVEGEHHHWDLVLKHCFSGLDSAIQNSQWCQNHDLLTGEQYGRLWMASVLRNPFRPLPYLFLYSQGENRGKSTFHESFPLLITKGCMDAGLALTSQNSFNGELADAILAYIEELDISKAPRAKNRIKDWVTSSVLTIHKKFGEPYPSPNMLHFVQTANSPEFCPIFPGDSRIVMTYVSPIENEIDKIELFERLKQEAPAFLFTLLNMDMPPSAGRLYLPILETESKRMTQELNKTPLEQFLDGKCFKVDGAKILFSEFFDQFVNSLESDERAGWHKRRLGRDLSTMGIVHGIHTQNVKWIGNLSWVDCPPDVRWQLNSSGRLFQ